MKKDSGTPFQRSVEHPAEGDGLWLASCSMETEPLRKPAFPPGRMFPVRGKTNPAGKIRRDVSLVSLRSRYSGARKS